MTAEQTPAERTPADPATVAAAITFGISPLALPTAIVAWHWQHHHLHRPRLVASHIAAAVLAAAATIVIDFDSYATAWMAALNLVLGNPASQPWWQALARLAVAGLPLGWAAGAASRWWWDSRQSRHPINGRAHRTRLDDQRRRLLAADAERRPVPLTADGAPVIGVHLDGEPGEGWVHGPDTVLHHDVTHVVAIGASGAGKTESLLRLAAAHVQLGWQVIVIDAKEDPDTGERLAALARSAGINPARIRTWPAAGPIDLCRGNGIQIRDRFLACAGYTEPYYEAVASTVLRLACTDPTGQPRTLHELVSRIEPNSLKARWIGTPDALTAANLSSSDLQGVRYRYSNLAASLEHIGAISAQPGGWSWDTADVAWVTLPTSTQTATAAALGRAALVDLISYIRDPNRRPVMSRPILLIVEELGAIVSGDPATAQLVVEAFERARSANVRAVVSVQTVHGLGEPATQARILHSGAAVLAHRMPQPEEVSALLGTRYGFEASLGVDADGSLLERGSLREQHQFVLAPSVIRGLATGEAVLVHRNNWARIKVPRVMPPG